LAIFWARDRVNDASRGIGGVIQTHMLEVHVLSKLERGMSRELTIYLNVPSVPCRSDKIWFGLQRPPTGWYVWTDKDATVLDKEGTWASLAVLGCLLTTG
jgi:hypothetical protein